MGKKRQIVVTMVSVLGLVVVASSARMAGPAPQAKNPKVEPKSSRVDQFADLIAGAYQASFDDLTEVKNNRFGMSRIESSHLERHFVRATEYYPEFGFQFEAVIFGNHGYKLDSKTMELRYQRNLAGIMNRGTSNAELKKIQSHRVESAEALIQGKKPPATLRIGDHYYVVRPARLTSKECLACHTKSKVGDPIAIMSFHIAKIPGAKEGPKSAQ